MVVKSNGILPKMAETFRLRIYDKLPRIIGGCTQKDLGSSRTPGWKLGL